MIERARVSSGKFRSLSQVSPVASSASDTKSTSPFSFRSLVILITSIASGVNQSFNKPTTEVVAVFGICWWTRRSRMSCQLWSTGEQQEDAVRQRRCHTDNQID